MAQINIPKMHGAANSFLIIDAIQSSLSNLSGAAFIDKVLSLKKCSTRADLAKNLCDIKVGIGADGILFLESSDQGDFRWDFYNQDGSEAEMCGNAARCICRYAVDKGYSQADNIQFLSKVGLVAGKVLSHNEVQVGLTPILKKDFQKNLNIQGQNIQFDFVNSGVPHCVIQSEAGEKPSAKLKQLASQLRWHPEFQPAGSNVTFYSKIATGSIAAISFERGVEDFTRACGTGAVAAAESYKQSEKKEITLVKVQMPGGLLQVDFSSSVPQLIGPVEYIANCFLGE